jgi:hypothetical protein
MKKKRLLVLIFFLCTGISGCTDSSVPQAAVTLQPNTIENTSKMKLKNIVNIKDPNSLLQVDQMPPISPMSDEQLKYVIDIFSATMRVIEGTTTLETEEKNTYGEGQFFWPKDPKAPTKLVKSFLPENFRMTGIALVFGRTTEGSRWRTASFSIHPKNFPNGIYQMNIPKDIFSEYKLIKAELSIRPDEHIKRVNFFHYINKSDGQLVMTIEAHEDVSSLNDIYPSSFHAIQFQKLD